MLDLCTYNIRGLNNKQSFVKDFIASHNISFLALLETRVTHSLDDTISRNIGPSFNWLFNYDWHPNGRIWLGWDPNIWTIQVLSKSAQAITCSFSRVLDPLQEFVALFMLLTPM